MFDRDVTTELVAGGGELEVDNNNRAEFVRLYVSHLLETSVARQFDAFAHGFHSVCGGDALTLFMPEELELVVCGRFEKRE